MLVTLARGLMHGGSAQAILWAAWLSLVAFAAAGYLVGWIAGWTVDEAVRRRIAVELAERESPSGETGHRTRST
jgi:hypothetical protein